MKEREDNKVKGSGGDITGVDGFVSTSLSPFPFNVPTIPSLTPEAREWPNSSAQEDPSLTLYPFLSPYDECGYYPLSLSLSQDGQQSNNPLSFLQMFLHHVKSRKQVLLLYCVASAHQGINPANIYRRAIVWNKCRSSVNG